MLEGVSDFLIQHGSNGVVIDDDDPDVARITAYLRQDQCETTLSELDAYLAGLREIFPLLAAPQFATEPLKTENWAVAWKDRFESIEIGRNLMVTPPWLDPARTDRRIIIIEPAEAFGTGTHETTQGCLELLEDAVDRTTETREAFSMLDIGCGSGILAIGGLRLGASEVRAVDNDPIAVEAAARNAALNDLSDRLHPQCLSLEELTAPADVVTANLDPATLSANREKILSLFKNFLVVSGVPLDQWEHVKKTLTAGPVHLVKEIIRSDWGCGLFVRGN